MKRLHTKGVFDSSNPDYRKLREARTLDPSRSSVIEGEGFVTERVLERNVYSYPPSSSNAPSETLHLIIFPQHFRELIELCNDTGAVGILPDYPKAPENGFKDAEKFRREFILHVIQRHHLTPTTLSEIFEKMLCMGTPYLNDEKSLMPRNI